MPAPPIGSSTHLVTAENHQRSPTRINGGGGGSCRRNLESGTERRPQITPSGTTARSTIEATQFGQRPQRLPRSRYNSTTVMVPAMEPAASPLRRQTRRRFKRGILTSGFTSPAFLVPPPRSPTLSHRVNKQNHENNFQYAGAKVSTQVQRSAECELKRRRRHVASDSVRVPLDDTTRRTRCRPPNAQ